MIDTFYELSQFTTLADTEDYFVAQTFIDNNDDGNGATADWITIADINADGNIDVDEWKTMKINWHMFWEHADWDATTSEYVGIFESSEVEDITGITER